MALDVDAPRLCLRDHRREPHGLGFEQRDLAIDAVARFLEVAAALVRIGRLAEALAITLAGDLILEQLADLGQREAGVVAQALDETQAFDVGWVVQAVVAVGAGGRLEEPDLLVVADRPGGQAEFGEGLERGRGRTDPAIQLLRGGRLRAAVSGDYPCTTHPTSNACASSRACATTPASRWARTASCSRTRPPRAERAQHRRSDPDERAALLRGSAERVDRQSSCSKPSPSGSRDSTRAGRAVHRGPPHGRSSTPAHRAGYRATGRTQDRPMTRAQFPPSARRLARRNYRLFFVGRLIPADRDVDAAGRPGPGSSCS